MEIKLRVNPENPLEYMLVREDIWPEYANAIGFTCLVCEDITIIVLLRKDTHEPYAVIFIGYNREQVESLIPNCQTDIEGTWMRLIEQPIVRQGTEEFLQKLREKEEYEGGE